MKILVAGCGKIGETIVASLAAEGHNVVAIDNDPAVLGRLTNIYDVIAVTGNAADCDTLEDAGVASAQLFVAVTGSDELNMLSCYMAGRMGAEHTIARIRNPEYNDRSLGFIKQQLGLAMALNPDLLAAQELFNLLKFPSADKIETFSRRNYEMIELRLKLDSPLNGMPLRDLRKKYKANVLVGVVQRGNDVYIPDGSFVLQAGDKIGLTATPAELQKLLRETNQLQRQARSVMILGGSRTAYYLARQLTANGHGVRIIEKDLEHCQELSELLPKAVIIHGDGAQQELLLEEGLRSTDAFVALTGMDEENILISIFASSQQVPTVISKVNRGELTSMAEKLGLDSLVSPRKIVTDILVQYARALKNSMGSNVETLYKLMDDRAEALEFRVGPEFKMIGVPLKDMKLRPNTLVAGIIRDRTPIIPGGDDMILPGDRVIVLAADQKLHDLADILR